MKAQCPHCNTVYTIDEFKIPEGGASLRCKKCQNRFRIERPIEYSGIQPEELQRQPEKEESATKAEQNVEELSEISREDTSKADNESRIKNGESKQEADPNEPRFDAFLVVRLFDMILRVAKKRLNRNFFESSIGWWIKCGYYCLLIATPLGFFFSIALSFKSRSHWAPLLSLLWILILPILHYTAMKFLAASHTLIKSSPSKMVSSAFLDSFAIISIILGCFSLVVFVFTGIVARDLDSVLVGFGIFILCEYLACISMNPEVVNVRVKPGGRVGEEAIGVLSFIMKGLLKLLPVAFGAGVISGTLMLLNACIYLLIGDEYLELAILKGIISTSTVTAFVSLPFLGYVLFLIYYLTIDLIQTVLVLPNKLDSLSQRGKSFSALDDEKL